MEPAIPEIIEITSDDEIDEVKPVQVIDLSDDDRNQTVKYIFITIATIGAGKTTIGKSLEYLYPGCFSHVQNDNIKASSSKKLNIVKLSLEALKSHDAVIIDRNNPTIDDRRQLLTDIQSLKKSYLGNEVLLKVVCLNFIKPNTIKTTDYWKITTSRVMKRGDNHQSIKAKSQVSVSVYKIMRSFINRFQLLDVQKAPDSKFDLVIHLNITNSENSSLNNLKHIIEEVHKNYKDLIPILPTIEDYTNSFNLALLYKPTFQKSFRNYSSKVAKPKTKKNR